MRVLILVNKLTGGGAERVASLWGKGFILRGNDVHFVFNCSLNNPVTYEVPRLSYRNIYNFWAQKVYSVLGIAWLQVHRLRKEIILFRPDVIICVLQPWAEWARKATRNNPIRIINTEHNTFEWPANAHRDKIMWKQKYEWNKRYDTITVLTEKDKQLIDGLFQKVFLMPNPLPFSPVKEIPQKERVILAVGRLNGWYVKGFDILIESWARIAKKHPDWILQIAGDGKIKAKEYLNGLANELDVANQVSFLGFEHNIISIYQRASIFVLSSRYEGFGMVLIEAMSQGCAPIACDYKGRQREIITTPEEGIVCPTEDIDSLAMAMDKMISNPQLRCSIQKNAVNRSRSYELDRIMDRWMVILEDNK